ncbi:MAG: DUF2339 domain-containing protein [Burkholderiales bacterium]|nr:DUF2339 domain-containing protein [Burkholderiales bacterium]
MGAVIGMLVGLLAGLAIDEGAVATVALVVVGALAGAASQRSRRSAAGTAPDAATRLTDIERRLAALEAALSARGPVTRTAVDPPPASGAAAQEAAEVLLAGRTEAPVFEPVRGPGAGTPAPDDQPPPRPAYGAGGGAASPAIAPVDVSRAPATGSGIVERLRGSRAWAWFTGGNTLTRVGVVILFFGVAFLLAWLADHLTLSIEWKLALVALGGAVLGAIGVAVAPSRPGYGLSLQGAGAGVLYLTVFAAARLAGVLEPAGAFAALAVVATGTVALAWRADSQALAALAFAGGFLAPVRVGRGGGDPVPLFGWFSVLNVAIAALAWHRAWKALNALGAAFTFALAIVWGARWYTPAHFDVVQPFLAFQFVVSVAVAILHAKRAPLAAARPIDGFVVFGVPVIAFALEAGLVHDRRYGVAVAALVLAAFYAVLGLALRRRDEPGLRWLGQAFLALALVFATLAIPFAADARWTSAWWGLEAAAVWWLGCRQGQPRVRAFALLLQALAGIAFAIGGPPAAGAPAFANAGFLGAAMIGAAGLLTARVADRWADALGERERGIVPLVFAWGAAWWIGAGVFDIARARPAWLGPGIGNATLAWVIASAAAALVAGRAIGWSRLAWATVALAPAMAAASALELHDARTTLVWPGALLWPVAWALVAASLRRAEHDPRSASALPVLHLAAAVAFVAWAAWEAGEWTARIAPPGTVWIAVATAAPMLAFLNASGWEPVARRWPWARVPEVYAKQAGLVVAAALVIGYLGVNAVSPGGAAPLPWAPLVNPLDLGLAATLAVLWGWSHDHAGLSAQARERWLGAGLFVAGNGLLARTAHHWGEVPWRFSALFASKPLQAAVTLAWTATALVLMVRASRAGARGRWIAGAGLLALVVLKLFIVDLAALSGLPRVVAFLGAGAMLLAVGYFAPPPAASGAADAGQADATQAGNATPDRSRSA